MPNEQFVLWLDGKTDSVEPFHLTQPSRKQGRLWCYLLLAVIILVSGATSSSAATLTVSSTADVFHGVCSGGNCTIKDAVFAAETNADPSNTIVLQNCTVYTVTSPFNASINAFPLITKSLTIIGNGATIQRAGATQFRFFETNITGSLTVQNLSFINGAAPINGGGAILNVQGTLNANNCIFLNNTMVTTGNPSPGGAIYNVMGNVSIDRCTFRSNTAPMGGGFGSDGIGGASPGISISVTITRSSFIANSALHVPSGSGGDGGGIFIRGSTTALIRDTTVSGNSATRGGGIAATFTVKPFPVEFRNLTVVSNNAGLEGGGIFSSFCGGLNCALPHAPDVANCIVANNTAAPGQGQNYSANNGFKSSGHNLLGPGCCVFGIDPDNGNTSPNPSDIFLGGTLPLGPLTSNGNAGGEYHPLPNGSVAINGGDPGFSSGNDQLELPRVGLPGVCDIGAVEHRKCFVPPGTLQAWWPFKETASPAHDALGHGVNKGVWVGGPTPSQGMVGKALSFNGVNQFVRVTNNPFIDFSNNCDAITIDAWIKTCATGLQVFVDKRVLTPGFTFVQGYEMFVFNGRLGFQMANGNTFVNYVAPVGSTNLSDNRWHLVAVTVTRCTTSAQGILYVDGNAVLNFTPLTGSLSNTADLLIGGGFSGSSTLTSFNGSIDELEIFKGRLKSTEILRLYQAGWAGKCLGCDVGPVFCRLIPQAAPPDRRAVAMLSPPGF
ncbi:MAG TPA: LamG domain-containing protein [Blastocatellia bacterium]|nr:LamG domain-containing protein [Blastocatellia bacterium]